MNHTYSAVAQVLDHLDTTLLIPAETQPYHEFYQYPWFCRLIVLIYGLTLGIAGVTLWLFAYHGLSLGIQIGLVSFIRLYGPWLAYDFSIVWIFILASLRLSYLHSSTAASFPAGSELQYRSHVRFRWTSRFVCNILILVLLGSSAAIGYLITSLWVKTN